MIVRYRFVAPWIVAVVVTFQSAAGVHGNTRTWTSASGKQRIEAEFIKADESSVTIKRADGREVTVPLSKLCDADREFVAAALLDARLAEEQTRIVRGKVIRFYQIVRKSDRSELKELLAKEAQDGFDTKSSFFDTINPPDRGSAPRVKHVEFDQDEAVAEVSIKVRGKYYKLSMVLVRQDDDWLLQSLSAKDEEGQLKKMDFVTAQTVDVGDGESEAARMEGAVRPDSEVSAGFDRPPQFREDGPEPREPAAAPAVGPPPHAAPPPAATPGQRPPPRGHRPPPQRPPPPGREDPNYDPGDE